ncbi:MAG: hypothetical protein ACRD1P_07875 [Thermoanaerobaculia bacterium]
MAFDVCRRHVLAAILLLLSCFSRARADDFDRLYKQFSDVARTRRNSDSPNRIAATLLFEAAREGLTPEDALTRLEHRLSVGSEAALPLARAAMASNMAQWRRLQGRPPQQPAPEEVDAIEEDFVVALRAAPENPEILRSVADFYFNFQGASRRLHETYPERLVSLVQASKDPGGNAVVLLTAVPDSRTTCPLLPAALRRYPQNPALLRFLSQRIWFPKVRAPLAAAAWKALPRFAATDARVALDLAETHLSALLESGLSREAIILYESLPADLQKRIAVGGAGQFETEIDGVPYRGTLKDLRLDLAAAYFLEGRSAPASDLSRGVEPPARGSDRGAPTKAALLRSLLDPSASSDAFDLIAEAFAREASYPALWGRTHAQFSERAGYPEAAAEALRSAAENAHLEAARKIVDLECVAKLTQRETEEFGGKLESLAQTLNRRALSLSNQRETPTDAIAPATARLIAAPLLAGYTEKALPNGVSPVDLSQDESYRRLTTLQVETRFPAGLRLRRVDRHGDEIVALAAQEDGLGASSCWFLRSRDGGATWSRPLYTGLRDQMPYSVRPFSELPMIQGERLEIEVDAWEDDPEGAPTIMGGRAKKRRSGIYLEIPLALLAQDSDGDGLTDLLEEAFLTDPTNSDTDGDAIGDAEDSMPQVAFDPRGTEMSRVIGAVVEKLVGWSARPAARSRRPGQQTVDTPPVPDVALRRVFLFVGARSLFAGLRPSARILVLTAEEAKLLGEKLGDLPPCHGIHMLLMSKDGTRAFVSWSADNQSGSFRVVYRGGAWIAEELSYIVS